jgi:hypothetical protein
MDGWNWKKKKMKDKYHKLTFLKFGYLFAKIMRDQEL